MRLKIVSKGWERFTGQLGNVMFKDGVSVNDVSAPEAQRIGALLHVVSLNSSNDVEVEQVTPVVDMKKIRDIPAPELNKPPVIEKVEKKPVFKYSRKEIENIADKDGIRGLRKLVAEENWPVSARSIAEFVDAIMQYQESLFAKENNDEKDKLKNE